MLRAMVDARKTGAVKGTVRMLVLQLLTRVIAVISSALVSKRHVLARCVFVATGQFGVAGWPAIVL